MSQSRSNKEIIELFFEDQNNIWKGEAGMTIAECKTAEKELLRTILAQKDAEVAEAVKAERERIFEDARKKSFESDVDDLPNLTEGERYIHMGDLAEVVSPPKTNLTN